MTREPQFVVIVFQVIMFLNSKPRILLTQLFRNLATDRLVAVAASLAQRPEFRGRSPYLPDQTCPAYWPWNMAYPAVKSVCQGRLLDNQRCTLGSHYLTTWGIVVSENILTLIEAKLTQDLGISAETKCVHADFISMRWACEVWLSMDFISMRWTCVRVGFQWRHGIKSQLSHTSSARRCNPHERLFLPKWLMLH
jgi:hypothetical protein